MTDIVIYGYKMHSQGKYTPFEGTIFNVVGEKTVLRCSMVSDIYVHSNGIAPYFENKYLGKSIYV